MARWLIVGWALLVLAGVVGVWAWQRAVDRDDQIETCRSARRTIIARRAAHPDERRPPSDAALMARACAPLFREGACRRAHEHFDDLPPEMRAAALYRACADAYCPKLQPRPAACDQPTPSPTERPMLWRALLEAILRRELGDEATERLRQPDL